MKQQIGIRIRVLDPLKGVAMNVQRGKCELLPPVKKTASELVFEFNIDVDLSSGSPNFLGGYAQGPKDARFIYVNSGTYAGDPGSAYGRRAKLSMMTVTKNQVDQVLALRSGKLETSFPGVGRDGGPTCASVKGLVWEVVDK
jgi:hypothetical protein